MLSASGGLRPPDQGLCPWTPLGAPPPDPHIGSRSRARHILSVPVLFLQETNPEHNITITKTEKHTRNQNTQKLETMKQITANEIVCAGLSHIMLT